MLTNINITIYNNVIIRGYTSAFKINNSYWVYNLYSNILYYNNIRPNWLCKKSKRQKITLQILIPSKILDMLYSNDNYQEIIALKLIENKSKLKLLK